MLSLADCIVFLHKQNRGMKPLDSTAEDSRVKLTDFDLKRVKPNLSLAAENQVKPLFQSSFQFIQRVARDHKKNWKFQRGKRKRRHRGALHGGSSVDVCACVCWGDERYMTQRNDAKFHLFVFFSEVVLLGPGKFKNRAFLMEKRADGKTENSQSLES